jgi:GAF domain-containing protein
METSKKQARYQRLYEQVAGLMIKTQDPYARMATIVAVLHHKMENFFWTGFYLLKSGELTVQNYQGPLACQILEKNSGVCWTSINEHKTLVVPDVDQFPGHIACDSRSKSEIVVPVRKSDGEIIGVLDVDSDTLGSFDATDAEWLEKIVNLIYL